MTSECTDFVTLEDVATDRRGFAEAHARLKARAPWEWLIGGTVFSVGFAALVWLFRPSAPMSLYVIVIAVSYVVGGFATYMNRRQINEWYKGKGVELDDVEMRIRAGERVPRPNSTPHRTRA